MNDLVGKRVFISTEHETDVQIRLDSAKAGFTLTRLWGEVSELIYEDSPRADHLVAPFILPPEHLQP